MFSLRNKTLAALLVALLCAPAAALAQQATPAPPPKEDTAVTEKGFRSRVFEIKHRDPQNLLRVLGPLGSGFRGATMSYNQEFRTITVRDFPENLATIEEAIRRLDTPEAPRPGIEFHIHVLIASNDGAAATSLPSELTDVLKQLQTTINYKSYTLMTSQVLRAKESGFNRISSEGVASLKLAADTPASKNPIFYEFHLQNITLDGGAAGATKIQIGEFAFRMKIPIIINQGSLQYQNIGFNTPVNLREGEKVVVGTTSMEDKGLIVVLTASVLK